MELLGQVLAALLGGFLAAGTGAYLQSRLEKNRLLKAKQLLITAIKDDLENSVELYQRVKEDYDKSKIFWFHHLGEFNESRTTVIRNWDYFYLIEDEKIRKRFLKYYTKSYQAMTALQGYQQQKYGLETKLNDTVQKLMLDDNRLTHEIATTKAIELMKRENLDYAFITEDLPKKIGDLNCFKQDANGLLSELK